MLNFSPRLSIFETNIFLTSKENKQKLLRNFCESFESKASFVVETKLSLSWKKEKTIKMKDIVNFFAGRRYSAVHTSEMQVMGGNQKSQKSSKAKPTLDRGLSVIDALFHERKQGKRTRLPKSKFLWKFCIL